MAEEPGSGGPKSEGVPAPAAAPPAKEHPSRPPSPDYAPHRQPHPGQPPLPVPSEEAAAHGKLPGLSVIVTAYNEEGALEEVVEAVRRVAPQIAEKHEILIVNDGSRDRTPEIANRLGEKYPLEVRPIHHPFNLGFGGAQKTGFVNARYEWCSLVPGDHQFYPEDLAHFLPFTKTADIVVGYRVGRKDSWMRRTNTKVFRFVMRLLFGVTLRDINWVKLFRRDLVSHLDLEFRGIGVDAEVVVKAARKGCRFAETQVGYHPRTTGVSTGDKFINVVITILELIYLAFTVGRARRPQK